MTDEKDGDQPVDPAIPAAPPAEQDHETKSDTHDKIDPAIPHPPESNVVPS